MVPVRPDVTLGETMLTAGYFRFLRYLAKGENFAIFARRIMYCHKNSTRKETQH